ncbi:MAG: VWA domain-containing protein [Blautia sp.]|nr:VWA domain-containing protein [Blautia sp.]
MKKAKKVSLMWLLLLIMAVSFCRPERARADAPRGGNFDVVFVIDASGSMKYSDQKKLRFSAGQLFTDLVASDTARAGYVQFTNKIMETQPLTSLADSTEKDAFRQRIAALKDAEKPDDDTDIGLGLEKGLMVLKDSGALSDTTRTPLILFISDGNTDFSDSLPTEAERQAEEQKSNAKLAETLQEAGQLGVPIYVIGLNDDGKLDEANARYIAESTGGKHYIIDSAQEFTSVMEEIFVVENDAEAERQEVHLADSRYSADFEIENNSVLTANISIINENGVNDIRLLSPTGEEVPLDEDHQISVSQEISPTGEAPRYSVVKIYYPMQGHWQVSVQAEPNASADPEDIRNTIQINLITSYDFTFQPELTGDVESGQDIGISAKIIQEGKQVEDDLLLDGTSAYYTLTDRDGNIIEQDAPMEYDASTHSFNASVAPLKAGDYTLGARLSGKSSVLEKEAEPIQFSVTQTSVSFEVEAPEEVEFRESIELTGKVIANGEEIKDADLLKDASAFYTLTREGEGAVAENVPMSFDPATCTFTATVEFPGEGNYLIDTGISGEQIMQEEEPQQLRVNAYRIPITLKNDSVEVEGLWHGPINRKGTFNITDYVECESPSVLECSVDDGSPVELNYEPSDGTVTLSPLAAGEQSFTIHVTNEYGDDLALKGTADVFNSIIVLIIAAVVVALIILGVILFRLALRPSLTCPIMLGMSLPYELRELTPPETKITMPGKKTFQSTLFKLIMSDQYAANNLGEAINRTGAGELLRKTVIQAAGQNKVMVKIQPKIQGTVIVDNRTLNDQKGMTIRLGVNERTNIQFALNGQPAIGITLCPGENSGPFGNMGGSSTPFGNSGGSSSPFGGPGRSSNPFGNSGGSGSPFGGGQNPFGGGSAGAGGAGRGQNPFGGSGGNYGGSGGGQSPFGGNGGNYGGSGGGQSPFGGNGGNYGGQGGGQSPFGGNGGSYGGSGGGQSPFGGNGGNYGGQGGNPNPYGGNPNPYNGNGGGFDGPAGHSDSYGNSQNSFGGPDSSSGVFGGSTGDNGYGSYGGDEFDFNGSDDDSGF